MLTQLRFFFSAQQLFVFHHLFAGKMNDLGELNFNIYIIDFEYLELMSSKLLNLLKVHINCTAATQILSAFGIDT